MKDSKNKTIFKRIAVIALALAVIMQTLGQPSYALAENSGTQAATGSALTIDSTSGEGDLNNGVMPIGEENIAEGEKNGLTWVIDSTGHLTITGTDTSTSVKYSSFLMDYDDVITSAYLDCSIAGNISRLFQGFSNLTSVEFGPNWNTSNVTNMSSIFAQCSSLTELDLSGWDTSNVTDMCSMFCQSGLTQVDFSGWDTSKVTDMSYMFSDCNLGMVDFSDFDTENVTDMDYMFSDCGAEVLILNSFNTSNVTTMRSMFKNGYFVTKVLDISSFDLSNCNNLTLDGYLYERINLPYKGFTPSMLGYWGYTPYDTGVAITENDTSDTTTEITGWYALMNSNSTKIELYSEDGSLIESNVIYGCEPVRCVVEEYNKDISIENIRNTIRNSHDGPVSFDEDGNYVLDGTTRIITAYTYSLDGDDTPIEYFKSQVYDSGEQNVYLLKMTIASTPTSAHTCTDANENGFCDSCKAVVADDNTMYDSTDFKYYNDNGVYSSSGYTKTGSWYATDDYAYDIDTDTFTGYAWYINANNLCTVKGNLPADCHKMFSNTGIYYFDFADVNTSNVTSMEAMFISCTNLKALDLSTFNTENVTIMNDMFLDCYALASLDISSFDTSSVTTMESMFSGCKVLTSDNLNISHFDTSNVTDMGNMFRNCIALTELDLSNFDTSKVGSIGYMFGDCTALEVLNLSSFNTSGVYGHKLMFKNSNAIREVVITVENNANLLTALATLSSPYWKMSLPTEGEAFAVADFVSITEDGTYITTAAPAVKYPLKITVAVLDEENPDTTNPSGENCRILFEDTKYYEEGALVKESDLINTDDYSDNYGFISWTFSGAMEDENGDLRMHAVNDGYCFVTLKTLGNITVTVKDSEGNILGTYTDKELAGHETSLPVDLPEEFYFQYEFDRVECDDATLDEYFVFIMPEGDVEATIYVKPVTPAHTCADDNGNGYCDDNTCKKIVADDNTMYTTGRFDIYNDNGETTYDNWQGKYTPYQLTGSWYAYDYSYDATTDTFTGYSFYVNKDGLCTVKGNLPENSMFLFGGMESQGHFSAVTAFDFEDARTGNVKNMYGMFSGCKSIKEIDLSGLNLSNVETMEQMFFQCYELEDINLNNTAPALTSMSTMFYKCYALKDVDLSDFVANSVEDMSRLFQNCTALTSAKINIVPATTNLYGVFGFCSALTDVSYGTLDTSKVENMSCTFYECNALERVDLSGWDMSSATTVENMFKNTYELRYIHLDPTNNQHLIDNADFASNIIPYYFWDKVAELDGTEVEGNAVIFSNITGSGIYQRMNWAHLNYNGGKEGEYEGAYVNIGDPINRTVARLLEIAEGVTYENHEFLGIAEAADATEDNLLPADTVLVLGGEYYMIWKDVTHVHNYDAEYTIDTPATCTEDGSKSKHCACGDKADVTVITRLGHDMGEWVIDTPATEDTEGSKHRDCERTGCDYSESGTIPKLTHTHNYNDEVVAPTCTVDGYTSHTCACGDTYNDTTVTALGHDFGNWETTKEPTYDEEGLKVRRCKRSGCGFEETSTISKLERPAVHTHTFDSGVVTAPTCTETGFTTFTCGCGYSQKDNVVPALGHNLGDWIVDTAAGCESTGAKHKECSRCSYTESGVIPATGHNYKASVTAATCTTKGFTTHTCEKCGKSYQDTETKALGHNMGSWKTVKAATYTSTGTKERTCSRCDYKETDTIPKKTRPVSTHTHYYDDTVVAPTCTQDGYTESECSCGASYTYNETPALGHDMPAEWSVKTEATCVQAGLEVKKCSRCDYEESREIPVANHKLEETWSITKEATCLEDGHKHHMCLTCGKSFDETVIKALGHDWNDGIYTEPTLESNGFTTYTCKRCNESYVVWDDPSTKIEPTPTPTSTPIPTATPTPEPTATPVPTVEPTSTPAPTNTPVPTEVPTVTPEPTPTEAPEVTETPAPTEEPVVTPEPTVEPSPEPTEEPTPVPTETPDDVLEDRQSKLIPITIGATGTVGVGLLIFLIPFLKRKKKKKEETAEEIVEYEDMEQIITDELTSEDDDK